MLSLLNADILLQLLLFLDWALFHLFLLSRISCRVLSSSLLLCRENAKLTL